MWAVGGDRVGHLPDHGEHRPLGGVAHGLIGGVGGARERRGDQHRVDQLPRAAGELLGRPADDLAEDHAGVAARAHQRGAGDRVDDLVAVGRDRLAVEPVELLITACIVSAMLSPVSPSATGKTFRSLTSCLRVELRHRRPGRPGESARWRCRPPPDRDYPAEAATRPW